jgi:hypothetical protein
VADVHRTVRIKARGNSRQDICAFPPIWINIRKANIENENLRDVKKIKLVTHCGNSKSNEQYVLKEYLVYKLYNLLSPYSFRVRLVKVNYIDTSKKDKLTSRFGFLIEPEDMMAERLDKMPLKNPNISIRMTDTLRTMRMCIFQYMIGNADYGVRNRHNLKLLVNKDFPTGTIIPVPYDFDYTGLVNAHYAVPGENLGINSVTERYFLGPCRPTDQYLEVLDWITGYEEEMYRLVNGFEYLGESERKYVSDYLNEFFVSLQRPGYIERIMLSTCL